MEINQFINQSTFIYMGPYNNQLAPKVIFMTSKKHQSRTHKGRKKNHKNKKKIMKIKNK